MNTTLIPRPPGEPVPSVPPVRYEVFRAVFIVASQRSGSVTARLTCWNCLENRRPRK
jgi:hypothetical protein